MTETNENESGYNGYCGQHCPKWVKKPYINKEENGCRKKNTHILINDGDICIVPPISQWNDNIREAPKDEIIRTLNLPDTFHKTFWQADAEWVDCCWGDIANRDSCGVPLPIEPIAWAKINRPWEI